MQQRDRVSLPHLLQTGSDHDKALDFQRKAYIGGGRNPPTADFQAQIFYLNQAGPHRRDPA
jgi:hypothetical protein